LGQKFHELKFELLYSITNATSEILKTQCWFLNFCSNTFSVYFFSQIYAKWILCSQVNLEKKNKFFLYYSPLWKQHIFHNFILGFCLQIHLITQWDILPIFASFSNFGRETVFWSCTLTVNTVFLSILEKTKKVYIYCKNHDIF